MGAAPWLERRYVACGVTTVVVSAAVMGVVFSSSLGPIALPPGDADGVAGCAGAVVDPAAPGAVTGADDAVSDAAGRFGDGKILGVTMITSAVRMRARKKRLSIRKEPENYGTGS